MVGVSNVGGAEVSRVVVVWGVFQVGKKKALFFAGLNRDNNPTIAVGDKIKNEIGNVTQDDGRARARRPDGKSKGHDAFGFQPNKSGIYFCFSILGDMRV